MTNRLLYVCISSVFALVGSVIYRQEIQNLELIDVMTLLGYCVIIGFLIIIGCLCVDKLNRKTDNFEPYS